MAGSILDPTGRVYASMDEEITETIGQVFFSYVHIQEKWLKALFPQKPEMTEQQKKIKELEETILKAKQQIEELKGE